MTAPLDDATYAKGQRVRLSPHGVRSLWPRKPNREEFRGTSGGMHKNGYWVRVKWDHLKSNGRLYSQKFIEADGD